MATAAIPVHDSAPALGREPWSPLLVPITIYLWYLITTPYSRFPDFFETFPTEHVLVLAMFAMGAFAGRFRYSFPRSAGLMLVLFAWMVISYAVSAYKQDEEVLIWLDQYWKLIIVFFLLIWSCRWVGDVRRNLLAYGFVSLFYQVHSWADFVRGGSYVFVQGIKRLVPVWSRSGNEAAVLALFCLPVMIYGYHTFESRFWKLVCLGGGLLSAATVVYSGTRGGLLVLIALGVLYLRSFLHWKIGVLALAALIALPFEAPDYLSKRYTQWITGDFDLSSAADRSSYSSVHGRIEAAQDGFKIGLAHPVFGVGPGASRYARRELRGHSVVDTHNAFAQIVADLGLVGLGIFLLIYVTPFFSLWLIDRRWARGQGSPYNIVSLTARCLRDIFFIALCYGMFAHNAYTYRWLIPLAWYGAFVAIIAGRSPSESLQPVSPPEPAKRPIAA